MENRAKAAMARAAVPAWKSTPAAPGAANTSTFLTHWRGLAVRTRAAPIPNRRVPRPGSAGEGSESKGQGYPVRTPGSPPGGPVLAALPAQKVLKKVGIAADIHLCASADAIPCPCRARHPVRCRGRLVRSFRAGRRRRVRPPRRPGGERLLAGHGHGWRLELLPHPLLRIGGRASTA